MEDKLGNSSRKRKRRDSEVASDNSVTSSSFESEDEDDAGELVTEALDSEIFATLNAIRSKDPRVYDTQTTFYSAIDHDPFDKSNDGTKTKPLYLRDYHRQNLLEGNHEIDENLREVLTYDQEQQALKTSVVHEINAVAAQGTLDHPTDEDNDFSKDSGFLVKIQDQNGEKKVNLAPLDVENADQDPEAFLSNFMSSRAWLPSAQTRPLPFESDDDAEDRRAEEFEEAYNFRFEDPAKSNEKLVSHARDMASRYSVRRDEANARKKRRDAEGEQKRTASQELKEEKSRLRKLRLEEIEEKLKRIRRAAGLRGKDLRQQDWSKFLYDIWDDASWEEEMQRRFGEEYYAHDDVDSDDKRSNPQPGGRRSKLRKPKWEEDIDINDIVPNFEHEKAPFSLSDDSPDASEQGASVNGMNKSQNISNESKRERQERQKQAREKRKTLEQIVDSRLQLDTALGGPTNKDVFRYRETSPVNYGLSARDILMAADSQLNEFAGLKKLAAFRDPEKKKRDQKHLGKRARLRKWRKETFGVEEGLDEADFFHAPEVGGAAGEEGHFVEGETDARPNGRKKRRRKAKTGRSEEATEAH